MRILDIIAHKRDGLALDGAEIDFFVQGYTAGAIPDYQAAALLMAIVLRGMDRRETVDLTLAMVRSGEQLDLSDIAPVVADKHSSGGVGDKTTLVVGPLVAAAGVHVAKMSGRGLGFTGGTLDKLESIPGFRCDLSVDEFRAQLRRVGLVVVGQTASLVPADGKLYSLRDVTGTVGSLPLIAASIMSKKIASGANAIVLDVKVGHGAFMQTEVQALELAQLMVEIGSDLGRRVRVVVSDMDQPLGNAVGNALEVREALECLHGRGPADLRRHCLTVAGQMLLLSGHASAEGEAQARLEALLDGGGALRRFRDWIAAQGGDLRTVDRPERLPTARLLRTLDAPRSGYVAGLDARRIGMASMLLGGGRAKKGDPLDHAVGVVVHAKIADRLEKGQPLASIHANDEARLEEACQQVLEAFTWSEEPVHPPPLLHTVVG